MKNQRHMVAAIEGEYRRYKALGEGTFSQLEGRDLVARPTPESLSIAMIVWHIAGNLESRFTDFLTTDGEKPWRDRESEFADRRANRREMLAKWERGWSVLFDSLATLTDADLTRTVTIRGISATAGEALARSLAHTSYHVGQITYLGKMFRREGWRYLSIPPGMSAKYNAAPTLEKARSPAAPKVGAKPAAKKAAAPTARAAAKAKRRASKVRSKARSKPAARSRGARTATGRSASRTSAKAKKKARR